MVEARRSTSPLLGQQQMQSASESMVHRQSTASFAMRKVVVVGDTGVGKTAILSRFTSG